MKLAAIFRQLRSNLLIFLWLPSIFSQSKSFSGNPVIGNKFLNANGLHVFRLRLAHRLASFRRNQLSSGLSKEDLQQYHAQGFILKEDFLPAGLFEKLRQEVFSADWALREMQQGNTITRRVFLDEKGIEKKAPALAKLMQHHPTLKRLIRYVAATGGEPVFSIQAIITSGANANDPQTTPHADTFHSNAKAWLFLQDVADDDGPLCYVEGSHQLSAKRLAWEKQQSLSAAKHANRYHARGSFRASATDLIQMDLQPPKRFVVNKNTLVIADTFGFHGRAISDRPTMRIEIYASLRRNPFALWTGFHFLSLPWFKHKTGSSYLGVLEWLKKCKLGVQPWKKVTRGKIDRLTTPE